MRAQPRSWLTRVLIAALAFATLVAIAFPKAYTQSPPSVASANVDGSQLAISFTADLDANSTVLKSDFTVQLADAALAVDTVVVNTNQVVLTLEDTVPDAECTSDNISVSYSAGVSSLAGSDGTPVAAFSDQAVTNDTDAPPQIVSLETDSAGRFVYVTFCESISAGENGYLTIAAFTVEVNGRSTPVNDVQIQSETPSRLDIDFGRTGSFTERDDISVAYDSDDADDGDPPQDANQGNKQIESWAALAVTNRFDSPPTLNSITANYDVVTLTFSEELDENSIPAADAFVIGGIQHAPSVEDVSVSNATVTLVLSGILHNLNSPTYTLDYVEPNQKPLRQSDAALNVADIYSFSFQSSTPMAKPIVTKAEVNGAALEMTFNLPLKAVAPAGAFSIGGQAGVTISQTSFVNTSLTESTVTLTLSSAVSAGATITVSYTKPVNPPRIEGRNLTDADSFTNRSVTNNTVAPAPEFSSATVSADGSTATVTFTLALDASAEHTPKASTFSLTGSGASVDSVSIVGSAVVLSLDPLADVGETITLGYTPPADSMAARLQSADHAQPVAAFSNRSTTNNADGKPRPVSAKVDGERLTISLDRPLDSGSIPVATSVSVAGTSKTVTTVSVSKSDVIVTLSSAVNHTERISVSYTAPTVSPLKRDGQEIGVGSFVSLAVTNLAEDPTPTFVSASIDATGRTLTITMSHALLTTVAGLPDKATFSLGGSAEAAVDSLAVSGSTVVLNLDPAADVNETVTISYQPPTDATLSALQSSDGMWKVGAWTDQTVTNEADGVPRLISALANADSIVLEFDRTLDQDSSPPTADFSITPVGNAVTQLSIDGTSVTLTLAKALAFGDIVTVTYSAAGSDKLKRDGLALNVPAFSNSRALNKTPEPLVRSVVGDGEGIVISFSVTLDTNSTPDASAFSLGSGKPSVSSVIVSSMAVTLTLDDSLVEGETYTLTYTAPMNSPLQQSDGTAIADISEAVTNNTDVAPSAISASADGDTVSIEFDQSLAPDAVISANLFSITAATPVTVTTVSFDDDSLELTLSRALAEEETASIAYTALDQDGITDASGNRTASFMLAIDNQTDTAPMPVQGYVRGQTITIVLDQPLFADPRFADDDGYPPEHFVLIGSDATIEFVLVSNGGEGGVGKIEISLSREIHELETLTIRYFPNSGTIRIRDDDAGQQRAQINNYPLQNRNDRPAMVESATLDGETLTLRFDQALDEASLPPASAFAFSNDGPVIEALQISNATLTLNLTSTATEDADYAIRYTPTGSTKLRDQTGNETPAFSHPVDNTTDYAPFPISLRTNVTGTTVFLKFEQRLDPAVSLDPSWFGLNPTADVHSVIVDPLDVNGATLQIIWEGATPIREGVSTTLSYQAPATGGLRDDDAGNQVASFSKVVENLVDVAPVVTQVTVDGSSLQLVFDQPLDTNHVPPPNCQAIEPLFNNFDCAEHPEISWFTALHQDARQIQIESVSVAERTVTLTLVARARPDDSIWVKYSSESLDGGRWNLRDRSTPAHQVETLDPTEARNVTPASALDAKFDRASPDEIQVEFDGALSDDQEADPQSVSVMVGDGRVNVASVEVASTTLRSRLVQSVPECASLSIVYAQQNAPILDARGFEVEGFEFDIPNLIDATWFIECVQSDFGGIWLRFAKSEVPNRPGFQWRMAVNGESRPLRVESSEQVVRLLPEPSVCQGDSVAIQYASKTVIDVLSVERTVPAAAPCAVSAVATGNILRVSFDRPLDDSTPEAGEFAISSGVAIEAVERIDGASLTLRLAGPGVPATEESSLTYTGDSLKGSGLTVGPFALDISDRTPPPKLESAYAVGSSVFLKFDQALLARSVPASRFSLVGPGIEQRARVASVSGSSVHLELSAPLHDEPDLFGLIYFAGARGGLAGRTGARVGDSVFLVQNYTETRPSVLTASVDERRMKVTFDQRIEANGALPADFSVIAGRRTIAVESLDWSKSGVALTLAKRVTSLDAVALSYAPGEGRGVRDASNIPLGEVFVRVENETARPTTLAGTVDDARLRASGGATTVERELARGFASRDGLRVHVGAGEGWTRAVRRGLIASVDASRIGEGPVRIDVARIDDLADMLEQFASVPSTCWVQARASRSSAWWIGESDVYGVPTDLGVDVAVVGVFDLLQSARICVLDLISREWRFHSDDGLITAPSLVLIGETPDWFGRDRLLLAE